MLLLNGDWGVGYGEEGGWWERVRGTNMRRRNKDQQQVQPLDHGKRFSWGGLTVTVVAKMTFGNSNDNERKGVLCLRCLRHLGLMSS